MIKSHLHVAVIGASTAGLSCAQHLQSEACSVAVFDPAQGATINDIWHEDGWYVATREQGAHAQAYDALVLALPAREAADLLEPLLPATATRVFTGAPSPELCIWISAVRVGLCGGWLCGGKEWDAVLSGRAVAARLLNDLAMA